MLDVISCRAQGQHLSSQVLHKVFVKPKSTMLLPTEKCTLISEVLKCYRKKVHLRISKRQGDEPQTQALALTGQYTRPP